MVKLAKSKRLQDGLRRTLMPDLKQPDKKALEQAMRGHIVAEAQVVGAYRKAG
jgi:phosphatidylethanolamine-binding protein (PEBP) family uncharacterized protein